MFFNKSAQRLPASVVLHMRDFILSVRDSSHNRTIDHSGSDNLAAQSADLIGRFLSYCDHEQLLLGSVCPGNNPSDFERLRGEVLKLLKTHRDMDDISSPQALFSLHSDLVNSALFDRGRHEKNEQS